MSDSRADVVAAQLAERDARIAELEAELLTAQECVSETSGKLAFMRDDRNLYHGIARQQTETIDGLVARIAELEAAAATLIDASLGVIEAAQRQPIAPVEHEC